MVRFNRLWREAGGATRASRAVGASSARSSSCPCFHARRVRELEDAEQGRRAVVRLRVEVDTVSGVSDAGSSSGGCICCRACSRSASMGGGARDASARSRSVCCRLAILTAACPFDGSSAYARRQACSAPFRSPASSRAAAAAACARDASSIARSDAMRYSGRSGSSATARQYARPPKCHASATSEPVVPTPAPTSRAKRCPVVWASAPSALTDATNMAVPTIAANLLGCVMAACPSTPECATGPGFGSSHGDRPSAASFTCTTPTPPDRFGGPSPRNNTLDAVGRARESLQRRNLPHGTQSRAPARCHGQGHLLCRTPESSNGTMAVFAGRAGVTPGAFRIVVAPYWRANEVGSSGLPSRTPIGDVESARAIMTPPATPSPIPPRKSTLAASSLSPLAAANAERTSRGPIISIANPPNSRPLCRPRRGAEAGWSSRRDAARVADATKLDAGRGEAFDWSSSSNAVRVRGAIVLDVPGVLGSAGAS